MRRIATLEKMYGVKIVKDFCYDGKQLYKMYSADGCPWENGLTLKGLNAECEAWSAALLDIKAKTENR